MPDDCLPALRHARVLVLGGSSGIGLATAALASRCGAMVTIAARSAGRLQAALAHLPAGMNAAMLDMGNERQVAVFFAASDPWDHVIVSGASTTTGALRAMDMAGAHAAMQGKFWTAVHVARHARIREGGSLTLVSGVYSVRPDAHAVLQGAINAALEALVRGLALELAPGIRVNAVSPSTTDTPLWHKLGEGGRAEKLATMAARLPLQRVAHPDDIAQAILLVATNRFMTGSTLLVDGGDALG